MVRGVFHNILSYISAEAQFIVHLIYRTDARGNVPISMTLVPMLVA